MSSTAVIQDIQAEFEIVSCYDSHVHWLMTGEKKAFLNLELYSDISAITKNDLTTKSFKGNWFMGFGWNDNQFSSKPDYTSLDKISVDFPICFIKKDAHSCLLNSKGLELFLNKFSTDKEIIQYLELDSQGKPTGVLKESTFYALYSIIPPLTEVQIQENLLFGQNYFLSNGITHIRDMTCSIAQWQALEELEKQNKIKIQAEINFNIENILELENKILPFVLQQRAKTLSHVHIQGIKFFYDGSLGSETALLSEPYLKSGAMGLKLWTDQDVKAAIKIIWQQGLQVSIHTLGDEAVRKIISFCRDLQKEKITGIINLEHVELLAAETINEMKSLHVRCHMQPSHWLSDKKWISEKLSPSLIKKLFQWEALRKAKVPVFLGSDSPIEEANIFLNLAALEDSAKNGIAKLNEKPELVFSHPTKKNGLSKFKNKEAIEVYLDNECVFKKN